MLLSDIDLWNVGALQSIAFELGDELTTIEGVASDLEPPPAGRVLPRINATDEHGSDVHLSAFGHSYGSVATTQALTELGTPGFTKFVGILDAQAERLRTDLTRLGEKLRAAADVYDQRDHEVGGAFDSSVRYDRIRPAQRSRKMTARCTTKLMTVAVPCAMTNATGTRHGFSSHAM